MYTCICVCMYIYIYIYTHIFTHAYTYIHIYIYMCVYVYISLYIYIYICIHAWTVRVAASLNRLACVACCSIHYRRSAQHRKELAVIVESWLQLWTCFEHVWRREHMVGVDMVLA